MKKNIKNFKDEISMIQFLRQQLIFEPSISLLISDEELEEVTKGICDKLEPVEYSKEINSDEYVYAVEKYEDKQGEVHLFIQPIELDDNYIIKTHIENDVVIVLENLLEPECFDLIDAADELIIADYEEEDEIVDCDHRCKDCSYENTDKCIEIEEDTKDIPEDIDEFLEEKISEFIEVLQENEENEDFCFYCCIKSLLEHVFGCGYEDGRNSLAINISELLNDIAEGKLDK